jgi:hypothetical protein
MRLFWDAILSGLVCMSWLGCSFWKDAVDEKGSYALEWLMTVDRPTRDVGTNEIWKRRNGSCPLR